MKINQVILAEMQKNNNTITTAQVVELGFSRAILSKYVKEGLLERMVIRDIAAKESAVIVGRCADYILADRENTINVFIHAPLEARIKRIMELYNLDEAAAMKEITTSDKERGNHYFRYTDRKWGKAQNYDVCINSALMGIDKTVEMLADLAQIEER